MFDERQQGMGIAFFQNVTRGGKKQLSVKEGDSVTLRKGSERIMVANITRIDQSTYRGTIEGFEPSCSLIFEGLEVGEEIEFQEKHIIICHVR